MDITGLSTVASVTILCYLLATALKATPLDTKWLPTLCGVLGCLLGIAGYFLIPAYPATDPLTAAAVGVASGLAATGSHEAIRHLNP